MDLGAPLERRDAEALLVESHHAAQHPIEGVLAPYAVRADPLGVEMTLEAVHPELARLDHLLESIRHRGETLRPSLAAALASTVAHLAHQIHLAAPLAGASRVHRALRPSSILLSPAGSVALLGAGFPILDALLIPSPERESDRLRYLAPEAARGEPIDGRSDVYALGTLYYELAAQEPYRAACATSDLGQKALEGRAPDLPGTLVDPRAPLLRLLSRALAPQAEMRFASALGFAEAVETELGESGLAFAGPQDLSQTLEAYLGAHLPRGPQALVAPARASSRSGSRVVPKSTPTRPEPPAKDLLLASRPPSQTPSSPWRDLVEDDWPGEPPRAPPAAVKTTSLSSRRPPSRAAAETVVAGNGRSAAVVAPPSHGTEQARLMLPGVPRTPSEPTAPTPPARPVSVSARISPRIGSPGGSRPRAGLLIAVLLLALAGLGVYARFQGLEPSGSKAAPDHPATDLPSNRSEAKPPNPSNGPSGQRIRPFPAKVSPPPAAKPIQLLSVISQPSGATVELDGGYIGRTPLVLKHQFEKSQYKVTILQEGYERWEKMVSPDPKLRTINVLAVLQKK